jgi:hypothetical protein
VTTGNFHQNFFLGFFPLSYYSDLCILFAIVERGFAVVVVLVCRLLLCSSSSFTDVTFAW